MKSTILVLEYLSAIKLLSFRQITCFLDFQLCIFLFLSHGTKHLKLLVIKCVQITVCCNIFCALFCADVMVGMGYNLEEIQDSLAKMKYDEITATYLLLGRKASEVGTSACYHPSTSQWIRSSLFKLTVFTNNGDNRQEKE